MKTSFRLPKLYLLFLSIVMLPWVGYSKVIGLMDRIPLVPPPKNLNYSSQMVPFPKEISVLGLDPSDPAQEGTIETLNELFRIIPKVRGHIGGESAYQIKFEKSSTINNPEGYSLVSDDSGVKVLYKTEAGQFYGAQTLYQLLAYAWYGTDFLKQSEFAAEDDAAENHYIPSLSIDDEPAYRVRSFMADLGRAPYSVALLKRLIRIMGQLKMNTLHLHLYDDQLCGFRFSTLPLGHENPFSIGADDLKEIVRYARARQISVMPEMESWGHVTSIVYHYPELCGAPGMWAGASFGIGEKTYALLEKMYDEVVPCLEDNAAVHVGLDEATWAVLPGEENKEQTPVTLVSRIYEILMRVAERHHKKITMHLWADHGGRPLPKELEDKVVIEPWRYLGTDGPDITNTLAKYGGAGKTPLMMGGGANSTAFFGNYEGTRVWCQEGVKYPNVLGITLCMWESNDLAQRLVTLYGGATLAWTPQTLLRNKNDPYGERLAQTTVDRMRNWQIIFPDAEPAAINRDRGPEVLSGHYVWPPLARQVVAPTVDYLVPQKR